MLNERDVKVFQSRQLLNTEIHRFHAPSNIAQGVFAQIDMQYEGVSMIESKASEAVLFSIGTSAADFFMYRFN